MPATTEKPPALAMELVALERMADVDSTDTDQVSAVAYVAALLISRLPVEGVR